MTKKPARPRGHEGYFIEFNHVGNSIKVSAIDPRTGTEVSIVGDPKLSQNELSRAAVQKLEYVLAKKVR